MSIYLVFFLLGLPFVSKKLNYKDWWKRFWCRTACVILGIRLKVQGSADKFPDPYMTVCNHISFFDPVIALAVVNGMPVAKAEIAKYPLIGFAAKKTGIIWVDRQKNRSRSVARMAIQKGLSDGKSILVYPEGTISHSPLDLRNFKKGSFAAAVKAGVPIVFCAIYYTNPNAYWKEGNSLLKQFFLQFSNLSQNVHIHLSAPTFNDSPATSANEARTWIQTELNSIAEAAEKD